MTLKPLLVALLALPLSALAATTPDAGSILQQIQPQTPQTASPNATGLEVPKPVEEKLSPTDAFPVNTITLTGNTIFTTTALHNLIAGSEGKTLTLVDLNKLAATISEYYHSHGYSLAQAFIPPQKIENGAVKISIMEARYGKVVLDNHSRVKDPLLVATLSPLQSGNLIEQNQMDHVLLLLSDIPGEVTHAVIKPGDAVGTSDLLVNTTSVPTLNGNVSADDYGNRYTGRGRLGGTLNYIDPLHHGDILSVSVLTSGSDMNYGRVSYDTLLNGVGTRVGGSYSALHYILGDTLSALNGHGTAELASLWAKQPLVRSPNVNVNVQAQYDNKQLDDQIDTSNINTKRHLNNGTLSVSGDYRDATFAGSVSTWNVGVTAGNVGYDDATAQATDAATAKTQGSFIKGLLTLARLQGLDNTNSLYASMSGQWSNANLDSAEQMVAGGAYTVRGYDVGVLSGDSGTLETVEYRHDFLKQWHGHWQAIAFVDTEHVTINRDTWTTTLNNATLSGAGVGANWSTTDQWTAKAYVATPIGARPDLLAGTKTSTQGWVELTKWF